MRIFVVRHGESETNRDDIWTGWYDAKLTEKGINDAERAGELLRRIDFDVIFSSDLSRARKTAETAIPGCKYETSALLREISVGDLAGKRRDVITNEQWMYCKKVGYAMYGGETREDLKGRAIEFMRYLETLECENVAIFTHAGWLRAFLDEVLEYPVNPKKFACRNCVTAIFEYNDSEWSLHSWINLL